MCENLHYELEYTWPTTYVMVAAVVSIITSCKEFVVPANRAAVWHNICFLCPVVAAYAINTYRQPAQLFFTGGKEIVSAEGTTQAGLSIRFKVGVCPYNSRRLWLFRWPSATFSKGGLGACSPRKFWNLEAPPFLAWESKVNDAYH